MANSPSDRLKALDLAVCQLEKTYGKGTIMRLGDNPIVQIDCISTGSITVDTCLGVGGIPCGRITEIYGPESSGKTTLALHVIAEAQKKGGLAAFIDAEHAFDRFYAQKLGIDIGNLLVSQPDNGEQALEIADVLVRSGAIFNRIGFCTGLREFATINLESKSIKGPFSCSSRKLGVFGDETFTTK
jgi:recombination protein RecA